MTEDLEKFRSECEAREVLRRCKRDPDLIKAWLEDIVKKRGADNAHKLRLELRRQWNL